MFYYSSSYSLGGSILGLFCLIFLGRLHQRLFGGTNLFIHKDLYMLQFNKFLDVITFTFSYLADAFIQSDLQLGST